MSVVRFFGSISRKKPKPEVRGRVGLAFEIRGFSGQKPRKKVENSIGSTLKFSVFLQALVPTNLRTSVPDADTVAKDPNTMLSSLQ